MEIIQPEGWPAPKGYANGIKAAGEVLFLAGQVGWDERGEFPSDDFVTQVRQALLNITSILQAANASPTQITRMTWYITDKKEYLGALKQVGQVYREIIGAHYPVMTMVQVAALIEDQAKVEIEATAVIPVAPAPVPACGGDNRDGENDGGRSHPRLL